MGVLGSLGLPVTGSISTGTKKFCSGVMGEGQIGDGCFPEDTNPLMLEVLLIAEGTDSISLSEKSGPDTLPLLSLVISGIKSES